VVHLHPSLYYSVPRAGISSEGSRASKTRPCCFLRLGSLECSLCLALRSTSSAGSLAGGLAAALFAIIIGFPAFRLKGVYFVIGTLVLAEILRTIFDTMLPGKRAASALINTYNLVPRYYLGLVIATLTVCRGLLDEPPPGSALVSCRFGRMKRQPRPQGSIRKNTNSWHSMMSTFIAGLAGGSTLIMQPPHSRVICFRRFGPSTRSSLRLWEGGNHLGPDHRVHLFRLASTTAVSVSAHGNACPRVRRSLHHRGSLFAGRIDRPDDEATKSSSLEEIGESAS